MNVLPATRLNLTRFDLTVITVMLILVIVIALSAAIGISAPVTYVAYLKLDPSGVYNIWMADPANPDKARQLTEVPDGVFDFDVSDDGRFIIFAQQDFNTGTSELMKLDLPTNHIEPVTNCATQDADCTSPSIRPGGEMVAYERVELNTDLPGVTPGANRIWIVDLTTNPPSTYPLVDDSQVLGYGATWSADGTRIALYDNMNGGILIHSFAADDPDQAWSFVRSDFGQVGSLSPDGTQMVFPEMIIDGAMTRAFLQIAELDNGVFRPLTLPEEQTDDQANAWSPDGRYIAFGRTYRDDRFTRGAQIYLMDTIDNSVSPLVFDPKYANGFFRWDPEGNRLAIQRFQQLDDDGQVFTQGTTEVWVYNLETRQLIMLDRDARNPIWVP